MVNKREIGLEEVLAADVGGLRQFWADVFGKPPPARASADFMRGSLAWQCQANMFGGLAGRTKRRLERLALKLRADPEHIPPDIPIVKPDTRLVRDWQGETHEVEVREGGFAWRGEIYRSLSAIAREITGTRWNGLVFFGLKKRSAA